MNDKVNFNQFKFQTLSMLNLLEDAAASYPEGDSRNAAYAEIALSLGQPDDSFALLA